MSASQLAGAQALETKPDTPVAARPPQTAAEWNSLGIEFRKRGRLKEAVGCYQKALAIDPQQAGIWSNLGNLLNELKQFPQAIAAHREALARSPEDKKCRENMVVALNAAGTALRTEKQFSKAVARYREALVIDPNQPVIWSNLGNVLLDLARQSFPNDAKGGVDFASVPAKHEAWRQMDEAVHCQRRAVALGTTDQTSFKERLAIALNTRCVARRAKRQLRPALSDCQEAVRLIPEHAGTWTNLGNVLKDLKFVNSAIECHQKAIALKPNAADHYLNLAVAYAADLRSKDALAALDKAMALRPDDPHLRWECALNHLRLGQYQEGWKYYEARLETGALPERNPPGKPWRGESYVGQRLLIASEQGYGDTIWASRYLARVKALGGELILECRKDMVPLMESMGIADKVVAKGSPFPEADWHINVCSLPGLFVSTEADISGEPYIIPPADRMAKAKAAIGDAEGCLKVGIVWSGSTTFKANHDRAVSLRYFADAFALPGVQLYSLQKGPPVAELKSFPHVPIIDLGPMMEDFADAAAVVAQLDLVIMTDSAVAHLAGALGRPVWVLLNRGAYWLWSTEREGCLWYQSERLFRTQIWNDWVGTFDRAASKLMKISTMKNDISTTFENREQFLVGKRHGN